MLLKLLVAAGVLLVPVPALVLGGRGLLRQPGYDPDEPADWISHVLVVSLRAIVLLLVFALSAVSLVSAVGAMIRDVELHGLVYVFFVLDLLLALLILLSFGRRERRPARRRANPAPR